MLERKYGGRFVSRNAARTIQTAFRHYQMNKNFERLRSSMWENRMSRRMILSNMRFSLDGPDKLVGALFHDKCPSLTEESPAPPEDHAHTTPTASPADLNDAITALEDTFSRQVRSLAESIDDALSCCSLHEESLKDTQGHLPLEVEPNDAHKLDRIMASYGDVTLFIDEDDLKQSADWSTEAKEFSSQSESPPPLSDARETQLPLLTIEPPSDTSELSSLNMSDAHGPKPTGRVVPPRVASLSRDDEHLRRHPLDTRLAINGKRQSRSESDFSDGDNDSVNSGTNSTDTVTCSSESSRESQHTLAQNTHTQHTLTQHTYHKEARNSWDSPAFSNDVSRKRHYRIGLNLFNKYVPPQGGSDVH